MIHPSYSELIEAINTKTEDDDNTILVNSRYSLVLATSKRARQIIAATQKEKENEKEGAPKKKTVSKKPLSIAIDELYRGEVKILAEQPEKEEAEEELFVSEE